MSDLDELFAEELAADAAETLGEDVDNPDLGTDTDEIVNQDEESEIIDETEPGESDNSETDDEDFDWEAFADQMVPVKVDGEELRVPLRELKDGYQRQADYSRKTAELAEERKLVEWSKDLQESFRRDPQGTMEQLAAAAGMRVVPQGQPVQPVAPESDPYEDMDPEIAAVLRRLDAQEARHQAELARVAQTAEQFQRQQLKNEVQAEMRALKTEYGDDLDELEALQLAAGRNIPLSEAAEIVVFRAQRAKGQISAQVGLTAQEAAARRQAQIAKTQKRQATGTVTGSFDSVDTDFSPDDFDDIGELFSLMANSSK